MQKAANHTYNKTRTFELILSAMCIALVFVATMMLNIKLPIAANGGLVHLGTAMLLIVSILFGPKTGAIAGAFGMGIFDLVSGWTLWAPITFISRGLCKTAPIPATKSETVVVPPPTLKTVPPPTVRAPIRPDGGALKATSRPIKSV